jgi:hypothetical protein
VATGIGSGTIDFGAHPGSNEASLVVTGQATISVTSSVEAFLMAEVSGSHTAADASYATTLIGLACTVPIAATGFTINARSLQKMTGTFLVRWIWSD